MGRANKNLIYGTMETEHQGITSVNHEASIKAHIHLTIDRERIERMKKDYHRST
jgi:hypothetical protein